MPAPPAISAKRNVDIGSEVKAGDVLAVIAAPDLDQQLLAGRGSGRAIAGRHRPGTMNSQLAKVTNQRTQTLVVQGWQTKQQGDTDRLTAQAQAAAVQVAEANLQAGQAQVSRLKELTGFEKVVAPFDGFITQRHIDVGSLVTADQSTGTALFDIAHSEVLRTQIYVPQDAVFGLKDGASAEVRVPEIPGRVFHGTVARNANALTPGTRTRLTEVDVDNADGTLFPGLYCTVRLFIPRAQPVISIPAQALICFRTFVKQYRDLLSQKVHTAPVLIVIQIPAKSRKSIAMARHRHLLPFGKQLTHRTLPYQLCSADQLVALNKVPTPHPKHRRCLPPAVARHFKRDYHQRKE